jgi:hypothetical protein
MNTQQTLADFARRLADGRTDAVRGTWALALASLIVLAAGLCSFPRTPTVSQPDDTPDESPTKAIVSHSSERSGRFGLAA